MKVLYVEDNPANVFLVKRVARMGSHDIINYIDGDQALLKFDSIDPDLVLMDIQLAGTKSGLDVVRELRERGVETPIIAVTAYAMVGDKERCIEAGCTDYMAKPLAIPKLVELFAHHQEIADEKAAKTDSKADDVATTDAPQADTSVEIAPVNEAKAPVVSDSDNPETETAAPSEPVTAVAKEDEAPSTVTHTTNDVTIEDDSDETLPLKPSEMKQALSATSENDTEKPSEAAVVAEVVSSDNEDISVESTKPATPETVAVQNKVELPPEKEHDKV